MSRTRIVIIIAVVLALGLPVAADRTAAAVAADRLADRIRCAADLADAPEVSFGGVAFLPQYGRDRFDRIRVTARNLTLGKIAVSEVSATGRDVRLPDDGPARVGSASVDVTVAYTGVPGAQRGSITADDAGRLVIDTTAPLLGRTVPVTVYARVELDGTALTILPVEVEVPAVGLRLPADRLPGKALGERGMALPDLPAGLAYRSVTATDTGLRLRVEGTDITADAARGGGHKACGGTAR